ncbi:serine/arginine repetitive matrix protein 1 isoform X2 [Calliphora vicina]|uniref:serine/arginine repetitive matrix protein 1 isoform X2 n=1 Tax=Calliphora vicina TaxID=7373 RepID=UPI00325ABBBA
MKNVKRWMFITAAFLVLVIVNVDAIQPFKKVSIATTPKTISTSSSEADAATAEGDGETVTAAKEEKHEYGANKIRTHDHAAINTTRESKLTGIPQIDYIWDPNLPRELRGFNLSTYPFLSTTPPDDEIHFKCDGLHDGFYASIEYKCQVYHHCVYGIRHDFLCANFTAFDQRTFICHFASDVDCEGSPNFWNRNDALYMATTTTSTTTTTIAPPPTQRRRPGARPLRPLRRPSNRRPVDDYYYEDEEYDEDYYQERANRRRKQRPRHRKPVVAEYDDEYEDEKRSFADEKPRRANGRDRVREEVEPEDDYDVKPKSRSKPTATAERRKLGSRKPGAFTGRASADERRSFSDDRPLTGRRKAAAAAVVDEPIEPETPRRSNGRRRINEKRSTTASPASDLDDLDEYEKPESHIPDQEEAAADEDAPPKIKTTPKPLEEFVTPKAAPASVYARPRAPPRIARPVPVSAKDKFQYPVQRTATTSSPPGGAQGEDEEYYEDEEYDDTRAHRGHSKKRVVEEIADEEEDVPVPKRGILARKPTKTLRKPVTEKKAVKADEEDDYEADDSYTRRGASRRRNPLTSRTRSRAPVRDDVDFVDDDYEERPAKRTRPGARKGAKKPRLPEPSEEVDTEEVEPEVEQKPLRGRGGGSIASRRKPIPAIPSRSRSPAAQAVSLVNSDEVEGDIAEEEDELPEASKNSLPTSRPASVRVVKRPFLPSRGGSPYLPRGLQPVGVAHKSHEPHTTDSSMIDMFSTNSGVHLLEHGAPLLRDSGPRTTLPPRSAIPVSQPRPETQPSSKATLDELYENDYDVTLNDALNPTLKPLSPHQSTHYHQHHENNNNNHIRRRTIVSPPAPQSSRTSDYHRTNTNVGSRIAPNYYDDYEY